MYDSPAPDATTTPHDKNRSTIVNPRKIYTLTVVRLGWGIKNFENDFNVSCSKGKDKCRGLQYPMDLPVDGLFINSTNSSYTKHLLVGENDIPVHDLNPFINDDTENGDSYAGFGTATRRISLMTLATPAEDTKYSQKGDPVL